MHCPGIRPSIRLRRCVWLHTRGLPLQTLIMRTTCEQWPQRETFGAASQLWGKVFSRLTTGWRVRTWEAYRPAVLFGIILALIRRKKR